MKILIIKLGAKGDVIRTLPILPAIKEKYLSSEIMWLTRDNVSNLLENNPYLDKIFTLNSLPDEIFDILYNFDIDKEATDLAKNISAKEKYGFYSEEGFPAAFNLGAEYYLNTLFDDDLKKSNKKTYQEMMFEVAELPYKKQHYGIYLTDEDKRYAEDFKNKNELTSKKIIGIHMGASPRWPSKKWSEQKLKEFIKKVKEQGYEILLFAGPNEAVKHEKLYKELNGQGIKIFRNNPLNTNKEFVSLINICDKIVCSDSFALHISVALKKPTIALFFCTTPHEVEGYGYLKKIISPIFKDFFPEKQDQYIEELVNSISVEDVLNELKKCNQIKVVNAIIFDKVDKKFLIIKRSEGIHAGKWAFPGGVTDENESVNQALSREIKEETGLGVEIIEKISEYTYLRGDGSATKGECYLAFPKNKEVILNKESAEYKWVNLGEFFGLDHIDGLDNEILKVHDFMGIQE